MQDTSIHHNEPSAMKRDSVAFLGIFLVEFRGVPADRQSSPRCWRGSGGPGCRELKRTFH